MYYWVTVTVLKFQGKSILRLKWDKWDIFGLKVNTFAVSSSLFIRLFSIVSDGRHYKWLQVTEFLFMSKYTYFSQS